MTIDDLNESTSELTITPRSRKKNPKDPAISRKPGRPIGSKKRRPSKNDTLIFESSVDISNTGILDSDSNAFCMSVPDELPIGDRENSVIVNQEKVSDLRIGSHIEPLLHEETSNASPCIKCPTDEEKPKRRRTKASKPFKSAMDKALNEASRYNLVKTFSAPDSSRYVYIKYTRQMEKFMRCHLKEIMFFALVNNSSLLLFRNGTMHRRFVNMLRL